MTTDTKQRTPEQLADSWIRTDPDACYHDVRRLGLEEATNHNLRLIADRNASGDERWLGVTWNSIMDALSHNYIIGKRERQFEQ